ncbi:hypothetical protein AB0K60_23435 [Thermopolyspora sp. NPDC052614]|uniref:PDC sensor domain-containing protein n=1 Tax=Thermopolyspora sp. NPDC052614 TaxID=3155682 RepID=UPI003430C9B4
MTQIGRPEIPISGNDADRGRHGPDGDHVARAAQQAAARIGTVVEDVFTVLRELRDVTAARIREAGGRALVSGDLAALRPALLGYLGGLIAGVGFIAAPGLLSDAHWFLEWWQEHPSGVPARLERDLDPAGSAFYDYTHWAWYAEPYAGAERTICGPYVDYLCTDEYSLTLSVPVTVAGAFAGVAAADVFVRRFEGAVAPVLRAVPAPAFIVNAAGRVIASNTARWLGGSVFRGEPGFAVHPCGELPLSLVAAQ